ncbi:MAG: GxxExxY protein [Gloeobacteraceae cyanobacterium ES-bin-144]|nr:GxxExxY protein [Verrucomicrobiales bacterium]
MDTNERELIFRDEVYAIVSCSLEIIKGFGHGLHEKPYENALAVEFRHRGIPFEQQRSFPVIWRDTQVGVFVPDLIAYGKIVVDTKTIDRITDNERGQMLNYLRITGFSVGLIINFRKAKLEWERIILSQ